MLLRIVGGLGFALIAIIPIIFGGVAFDILLTALACIAFYELINTAYKKINIPLFLLMVIFFACSYFFGISIIEQAKLFIIAVFILAVIQEDLKLDAVGIITMITLLIVSAMTFLKSSYALRGGNFTVIYLVVAPCVTDMGAYFAGSLFGKHKLIERVSPKKTIEGAIGGWLLGVLVSFGLYYFVSLKIELEFSVLTWLFLSLTLPIISQFGDLAFSMIKRYFGIKDFGNIIPGHGGILDRLDSIVFVVSYFAAVITLIY